MSPAAANSSSSSNHSVLVKQLTERFQVLGGHLIELAVLPNAEQQVRQQLTLNTERLERAERLASYTELLQRWTVKVDLVAPASQAELIERHLVDSAAAVALLSPLIEPGPVLDIGSGAGLPGLVWSALEPERTVVLVEPRAKRVSFLKEARRELGLGNLEIEQSRFEDFGPQLAQPISLVIARALGEHKQFLANACRVLIPGGKATIMQGPNWSEQGLTEIKDPRGKKTLRLINTYHYSLAPVTEEGPQRVLPFWQCFT